MNKWKISLLLGILCLIGMIIFYQNRKINSDAHTFKDVVINPFPLGVPINDTNGKVPGNPQKAMENMKLLIIGMKYYCRKYGKMPLHPSQAASEIIKNYKELGLKEKPKWDDIYYNPDTLNSDSAKVMQIKKTSNYRMSGYVQMTKRPDGSPIELCNLDTTKKTDVIMVTDTYFFRNQTNFAGERTTMKPTGFYLVAWNDGTVEQVPYDKVLYYRIPSPPGTRGIARGMGFPGQVGLPAETRTFAEVHKVAIENGKSTKTP
jgi:hypothetical protein